ncbi:13145_t:CDS:10 [Acaulospora colombiana]|uniref:13145_t:CDS:1 n=1 Tax=Acaulospora colombiana TaxID=27376 RepID=A0ACA9JW92_9GLOM|nr:13145_t:CDS:10 [Acaulospora colombiana]
MQVRVFAVSSLLQMDIDTLSDSSEILPEKDNPGETLDAEEKSRKAFVRKQVLEVEELVKWHGLDVPQLIKTLDVILSGKLGDTRRLIKSLIPRTKVPSSLIVKILGNLGNKSVKLKIQLQTRVGTEPHIQGLLALYRDYSPTLVTIHIPFTKNATFKCPDVAWIHLLNKVYARWNKGESLFAAPAGKLKNSRWTGITTLEEISDVKQFAANIDKIEFPDRLASVLVDSRILQDILACDPQKVIVARVNYWIDQYLMYLVHCGDNDRDDNARSRFVEFFFKLVAMTEVLKELLPAIHEFMIKYIRSWNGIEHQGQIFSILAFLRPGPFDQISTNFLEPLKKLFAASAASWKARLIHCYTNLLKYWILLHATRQNLDGESLSNEIDYTTTIYGFINHIEEIAQDALEVTDNYFHVYLFFKLYRKYLIERIVVA